MSSNT